MFGHRPNSNHARICFLGFNANRVWLVSRFIFYIYICFILLQSASVLNTNCAVRCNPMSYAVISQTRFGVYGELAIWFV